MSYIVYILECGDGTLYIGSTNDMDRRLYAHNNLKSGAKYTKMRRPVVLKYYEEVESISDARTKEAEWKKLSRSEKLEMCSQKSMLK